ncbi:MAG: hypothetical protein O2930_10465 [Acidobacteria bacterium]|nr:hypothetical protein [Acidobacteriota bacterium]
MPSQFSTLGFQVTSGEDLAELASSVADRATTIQARDGQYLRWAPPSGEELWLQVKSNGDAMGLNPHFTGKSSVRTAVEARITRETHTPLDGTFLAWANPPEGALTGGDYPFAFDCPDADTFGRLSLPAVVDVQIAAFAQNVTVFQTEALFAASQAAEGMEFEPRSFIPSGLISPEGHPVNPPEPHALFVGGVLEAEERRNTATGVAFWWALVETVGGTFDVVIDPALLTAPPQVGNVLSGWFWLSGRLRSDAGEKPGWFRRVLGR